MKNYRLEKDAIGSVKIPINAYYGSQTQRALDNFPISDLKQHREYLKAVVIIKKAAARVNHQLNLLKKDKQEAIIQSCNEILSGKFQDQFVISPYQAGAGTSLNMNVNEVIANRANELLEAPLGSYKYIHPNDHVNMSQSTNDVIPAAIRIAACNLTIELLTEINLLEKEFTKKAKEFSHIIKSGRTHLRDALPVTLGQEFSAYAKAIENDYQRITQAQENLIKLGIGGTATGTGINTHPDYHRLLIAELSRLTGIKFKSSGNLFESMQNSSDFLHLSSSLKILAQNLIRIGNDLRLLSSGPLAGFAEITLPQVQAGSSIMPGKTNPSIVEMMTMVCFQMIGFDQTITMACMNGQLELNVWLPLIAYDLLEQIKLLTKSIKVFTEKCVRGIKADEKMCRFWFERGSGIAAILNPYLGYDKTAALVKESLKTGKNLKELVIEKRLLTREKVAEIFDIKKITGPNL